METKKKLRHNEYYDVQDTFDTLYYKSQKGYNFYKLVNIMSDEDNIRLAYRNIKSNTGSKTKGTDGSTIKDINNIDIDEVITKIKTMFDFYTPKSIRRVEIPKANGKTRPLGIPTIWDRLFQQCILQVLEPICEAKFHKHSYGFRPNRSTHHAITRSVYLINITKLYHCVDVDIKGFFDNVNHGKLLKQLWALGVKDKKLLKIISVMLKAPIEGIGIPTKGVPQGGILSPLLSNIVLNELDWWVSNQWETFKTDKDYTKYRTSKTGKIVVDHSIRNKMLKKSKLKEIYIVRYADDFKIFCRTRSQAKAIDIAVGDMLKNRLGLECSAEKSKVLNLKKSYSEFLGFKMKAEWKRNKLRKTKDYKTLWVAKTYMSDKAKTNATTKIRKEIKKIKKRPTKSNINSYNSVVHGIQNYYKVATHITKNLRDINYSCSQTLKGLKNNRTEAKTENLSMHQRKRYKGYNPKYFMISGVVMSPIYAQKNVTPINFSQDICNYTKVGRGTIHQSLKHINKDTLKYIKESYIPTMSIEYNDNRISKYIAQHGKCISAIMG
ncbi:group II intron reverse transcriptase/maturase, partial [Clostridium botulinum]